MLCLKVTKHSRVKAVQMAKQSARIVYGFETMNSKTSDTCSMMDREYREHAGSVRNFIRISGQLLEGTNGSSNGMLYTSPKPPPFGRGMGMSICISEFQVSFRELSCNSLETTYLEGVCSITVSHESI